MIDEKEDANQTLEFNLYTHEKYFNEIKNYSFKEMAEKLKLMG